MELVFDNCRSANDDAATAQVDSDYCKNTADVKSTTMLM